MIVYFIQPKQLLRQIAFYSCYKMSLHRLIKPPINWFHSS